MSTIGGGVASPEFEKLIQLAQFVQEPGYLDRVKELRDLEASSQDALAKANAAIAVAKDAKAVLDKRELDVSLKEQALEKARQAHAKCVAGFDQAIGEYRSVISGKG